MNRKKRMPAKAIGLVALLLAVLGCFAMLTGCSAEITQEEPAPQDTQSSQPEDTQPQPEDTQPQLEDTQPQPEDSEYAVFVSEEQDFSFLYDSRYTALWDDEDGATIYTGEPDYIPYLLVYRNDGNTAGFDVEESFEARTADMQASYGERLIDIGDYQTYTVSGKSLSGVLYTYTIDGTPVELLALVELTQDSLIQYTCKYIQADRDATMQALELAAASYQPSAAYYADTGDGAKPQAQGKPAPQTTQADPWKLGDYTITKSEPLLLPTTLYDGGFFSLQLPTGWTIETTGEYTTFGFRAYDPQNPERQLFFYFKHEPLRKSYAAQSIYQDTANMVGPNDVYGYQISADAPVLTNPTTADFFLIYNSYNDYVNKYGLNHQLPCFYDISILETYPNNTPTAANTLDNSVVRASFHSANGIPCQGLMAAQVTDKISITNVYPGVDMGFYTVYSCNGVLAPADEFDQLREQLCACLASFDFTQAYIRQAQQYISDETEAITSMAASMQAAYDSYNSAWSARQTSYDIISQKNSDATLGYDRLYDPSTGEVYRAELGFYDSYNTNRDQYSNPDLQLIDASTQSYYLSGVDYYIGK